MWDAMTRRGVERKNFKLHSYGNIFATREYSFPEFVFVLDILVSWIYLL